MVIVHPDKITRTVHLDYFDYFACKRGVRRLVVQITPIGRSILCCDVLPEEIVEETLLSPSVF